MEANRETVLRVEGMSCSSCVRHIDTALRGLGGVDAVEVQLREGRVVVKHDAAAAPVSAMIAALQKAGYDSALTAQR